MAKEQLLKYANSSQSNKKKIFALRDWCHRQGDIFGLQEVFDCLNDFAQTNGEDISNLIEKLVHKSKVNGRSSVVWGDTGFQMYLTRDEDGVLQVRGNDSHFVPNAKGQHSPHDNKVLRKDGQVNKNLNKTKEKLYNLGQEVRKIYSDQSNTFITLAMVAIKKYAKEHKKSEMSVVDKLKKGVLRLDANDWVLVPNNHTIKLDESQVRELAETTKLTEYKFYNNVQRFLSDLLKDPVGAQLPFLLQVNDITRNYLLYHLKSLGIIKRHQKISDKDSQGNPKTAKMVVKYSVPKKDFVKKMKKLFITTVAKNVPDKLEKILTECDGGAMGGEAAGATSADTSGQFNQPLFGVQRRKMPREIDETTAASNAGNYQYTVPFASDKETRNRKPGFSVKRQNEMYFHKKKLLNEDRESKNLSKARRVINQMQPNMDAQKTLEVIRNYIPNSRLMKCEFLPGVTRMVLDGLFNDESKIRQLNQVLKYIATEEYSGEYNQDLNGEDAETLINRFSDNVQQDIENDKQNVGNTQYKQNNNYNIVKIHSFEEAEKYGRYTSWCVTHDPNMYNSYTAEGDNIFYFCLKDGFENIQPEKGENCPKDEYGLSMIAVSVCPDGSLNTATCRWNHDNGGDDNILTTEEISQIIGRNFYQTFLPLSPEDIKEIKQTKINELMRRITEYNECYRIEGSRYLTNLFEQCIIYDTETKKIISGDYIFSSVSTIIKFPSHIAFRVNYNGEFGVFFPEYGFVSCSYDANTIHHIIRDKCDCLPCDKNGGLNYFDINNLTYLYDEFSDKIPSINTMLSKLKRKISKVDILNFQNMMDELNSLKEKGIRCDSSGIAMMKNENGYALFDVLSEKYPKPIYVGNIGGYFCGVNDKYKDMFVIINNGKYILYSLRTHNFVMNGYEFDEQPITNNYYITVKMPTDNNKYKECWYELDFYGRLHNKIYKNGSERYIEKIS
jgi:hypothetical protein